MDSTRKPVAVVVGATSKWQADGRNTQLAHGKVLDDSDLPVGVRWGVGGAIAQMNPVKIAEAFYYLHTQDQSCWTHELQLTPFATKPSF
jgi:hypothetical protein